MIRVGKDRQGMKALLVQQVHPVTQDLQVSQVTEDRLVLKVPRAIKERLVLKAIKALTVAGVPLDLKALLGLLVSPAIMALRDQQVLEVHKVRKDLQGLRECLATLVQKVLKVTLVFGVLKATLGMLALQVLKDNQDLLAQPEPQANLAHKVQRVRKVPQVTLEAKVQKALEVQRVILASLVLQEIEDNLEMLDQLDRKV